MRYLPLTEADRRAMLARIFDVIDLVLHRLGVWKRRNLHPFIPGHSDFQFVDGTAKSFEEVIDNIAMDEEHFYRSTALTVECQRSQHTLAHSEIKIGIRQDDRRVLGF